MRTDDKNNVKGTEVIHSAGYTYVQYGPLAKHQRPAKKESK